MHPSSRASPQESNCSGRHGLEGLSRIQISIQPVPIYVHVTCIFPCGTSLKAPIYSPYIPCFLAGKGSTIHETLRHFCLTFCHLFALLSLPHVLWIYGGASKGQDCKPDNTQMRCLALWMTPLGRRHRSEACGHLLVVTWIREHQGGRSVPGALAACVLEGLPQGWKQIPTGSITGSTAHVFSLLWQFCCPTSLHRRVKLLKYVEV